MCKSGKLKLKIAEMMEEFWIESGSQEWVAVVVFGIRDSFGA